MISIVVYLLVELITVIKLLILASIHTFINFVIHPIDV